MPKRDRFFVGLFAASILCLCVAAPERALAQETGRQTIGATAQDRLSVPWWKARHEAVLAEVKSHPDAELLWIGDSITNNFEKSKLPDENFLPTWNEFYAGRKALNLGFSGDTTGNVLWRLRHGEVDQLHPKVAIVLIGTNNTGSGHQSATETEVGIDAVVSELEVRLPESKVLLLGLLPSAISAAKSATDAEVNQHLAAIYGEDPQVTFLDVGSIFFHDGLLDTKVFYDPRLPGSPGALHPDTVGQRRMAEAIEPTLARLMDEPPVVPLTSMTDINTALIPVTRLERDSYDWFARHHAELLAGATLHPRIVLLGDSITHFWGGMPLATQVHGEAAWQSVFGSVPVLNMGFGWDRIQNVFWRLQHGEFDGLRPDLIVVNIGTNNLTGTDHARANTPAEVADGIAALCSDLFRRSPGSRIVLMAIFPRGDRPDDPLRVAISAVDAQLAEQFRGSPKVTLLDLTSKFVKGDGTLRRDLLPDGTHPNEAGYALWADALRGFVTKLDNAPAQ